MTTPGGKVGAGGTTGTGPKRKPGPMVMVSPICKVGVFSPSVERNTHHRDIRKVFIPAPSVFSLHLSDLISFSSFQSTEMMLAIVVVFVVRGATIELFSNT